AFVGGADVLLERNPLRDAVEILLSEPGPVAGAPVLLAARIRAPVPEQEGVHSLACAAATVDRVLTRAHQVAHRLVVLVGHIDRAQRPGAGLDRQRARAAPIGLDPIRGLLRPLPRRPPRPLEPGLAQLAGDAAPTR